MRSEGEVEAGADEDSKKAPAGRGDGKDSPFLQSSPDFREWDKHLSIANAGKTYR